MYTLSVSPHIHHNRNDTEEHLGLPTSFCIAANSKSTSDEERLEAANNKHSYVTDLQECSTVVIWDLTGYSFPVKALEEPEPAEAGLSPCATFFATLSAHVGSVRLIPRAASWVILGDFHISGTGLESLRDTP